MKWLRDAEKLIEKLDQEELYWDELLKVEYRAMWEKPRGERHLPMCFMNPQTQKGKWIVIKIKELISSYKE